MDIFDIISLQGDFAIFLFYKKSNGDLTQIENNRKMTWDSDALKLWKQNTNCSMRMDKPAFLYYPLFVCMLCVFALVFV